MVLFIESADTICSIYIFLSLRRVKMHKETRDDTLKKSDVSEIAAGLGHTPK